MTVKDLAQAIGTSGPYVTMLENSERRLYNDWVLKIAYVLRCHPMEITTGKQTDLIAEDDREQDLLRTFRGLREGEKEMLSRMLDTFSKEKPNSPRKGNDGEATPAPAKGGKKA